MKIIRPHRPRIMPLITRRAARNPPVRLVSTTAAKSSSDMRTASPSRVAPALATRISTGPSESSTWPTASSTESASVTSQRTARSPSASSGGSVR